MSETLYRKRGRKYEPMAEYGANYDSVPEGFHLICVTPGYRSTLYRVNPAYADLLAALHVGREAAAEAMRKASEARPAVRELTAREKKAYAAWKAVMGEESMRLTIASVNDVLDAMEAALIKAAAKA
jgi:hypothetical protein